MAVVCTSETLVVSEADEAEEEAVALPVAVGLALFQEIVVLFLLTLPAPNLANVES